VLCLGISNSTGEHPTIETNGDCCAATLVVFTARCHKHLAEMPCTAWPAPYRFRPASTARAKFTAPASDRLVRHGHAALEEQLFDVAQAGDDHTPLRPRSSQARRLRYFICLPRYGRQTIHESVLHWRSAMNKDQVKGTAEKVKGKVNETIGHATGDRKQEVKGDVQQAVGEARKKAGDVKEAVKDTTTQKP
jgi:uncharacterized protein YjbJ (UPF0337 family)